MSMERPTSYRATEPLTRTPHFKWANKRGTAAPRLAECIILAEFDIDSGSTVRHTYPSAVPGTSDDWFAEHMLPEGAHNHALDWTVMFLNRHKKSLDEDWPSRFDGGASEKAESRAADPSRKEQRLGSEGDIPYSKGPKEEEEEEEDQAAGRFLYCINLVRKLDDPLVRRGAVVKAMCICSRYHFVEAFRPMLVIALEQYYRTPVPEVLGSLFDALNTADIADAPRPTPWEKALMRRGVADRHMGSTPVEHLTSTWTHTMSFTYGERKIRAALPLYSFADETFNPSVSVLITLFGQSVMAIYNAVLTGQRVLFVGYNHAAGDVCKIVLAACALVSPPVQGILHRAFPYASLSDLSFLETPSFVAGVTNPMFESHPEWWDVLCQLDLAKGSGTVMTAEERSAEIGTSMHKGKSGGAGAASVGAGNSDALLYPGDAGFAMRILAGLKAEKGESWARCEFQDYTQGLIDLLLDIEVGLSGYLSSAEPLEKLLAANSGRLRHLKVTAGITAADVDPWARCRGAAGGAAAAGQGARLRKIIRRFQLEKNVNEMDVREALGLLSESLETEAELQVLLGLLPESKGGVSPLALGLFSTNASARRSTVVLLQKLEAFESTRPAVVCMNVFFKLALSRQARQLCTPPPPPNPDHTSPFF